VNFFARTRLTPARRTELRRALWVLAAVVVGYLAAAYFALPAAWRWSGSGKHPAVEELPRITLTGDGIHGDPLNVAFIGTEETLTRAMLAAGWHPADPITCTTCLRIAASTLFRRPYEHAPVSNLYVWGRKQDLAFQQPVGNDARRRHHVRFWRSEQTDDQSRPIWIGGGTYDTQVGFSFTTGQITHHISPEVDEERNKILGDLEQAGWIVETFWLDGFHQKLTGYNGGGDPYRTDGRLPIALLTVLP
jgi:hypothetical protein